jgi:hypothetical protein
MEKNRSLSYLKFAICAFLFLPLFFQFVKIKEFTPLNGVQENKAQLFLDSTKNKLSWFDGTFQKYHDLNSSENLALKSPYIRLRNQIQYSLFQKINAQDVYQYDDVLFRFYTKNYHEGVNFMGEKKASEQISKLKAIQNHFGKETPFITLIAPSKTYFYEEKLPEVNRYKTNFSNYKYIKKLLLKNELKVIDYNLWFLEKKNSKIPIFGTGGIHWTSYASCLAMDSLVNYISDLKGTTFQGPNWKIKPKFKVEYDDHDLAQLLNVFFSPNDKNVKSIEFLKIPQPKKKIKALIISDSFFDVISKTGLRQQIFTEDSEYLYYFSKRRDGQNGSQAFNKNELLSKIKSVDCVFILNDIVNMEDFSWGFIGELYRQINYKKHIQF